MKRTCLFLVAVMAFVALFTCAAMSMAGPLGLFRNAAHSNQAEIAPPQAEVTAEIARPEDGDRNYLTVLGNVDATTVHVLRQSLPNAHFNHYREGDPLAERYRSHVGEFPAVVYQKPNGKVIDKRSGKNFPASDRELTGFVDGCRPFRPKPDPTPPVQPQPPVAPQPFLVPDTIDQEPADEGAPLWLYLLLFGGGTAGGAGYGWYKEIKGE